MTRYLAEIYFLFNDTIKYFSNRQLDLCICLIIIEHEYTLKTRLVKLSFMIVVAARFRVKLSKIVLFYKLKF